MKLAICFFGFLRSFQRVHQSIIEKLVKKYDADVFMCCPNIHYSRNTEDPIISQDSPEEVKEEELRGIFGEHLKGLKIIGHDAQFFKDRVSSSNLPESNFLGQLIWRTFSMFYMVQNSIKLRKDYQNINNIKYDVVILMRPDMEILKDPEIDNLDLNKVYYDDNHIAPVHGHDALFGDHIMISKPENIDLFEELYDKIPEYHHNEGMIINNETILGYQLIRNHIGFEVNNFISHILIR